MQLLQVKETGELSVRNMSVYPGLIVQARLSSTTFTEGPEDFRRRVVGAKHRGGQYLKGQINDHLIINQPLCRGSDFQEMTFWKGSVISKGLTALCS